MGNVKLTLVLIIAAILFLQFILIITVLYVKCGFVLFLHAEIM